MDKTNRLQELLGKVNVQDSQANLGYPSFDVPKSRQRYEGSDSESDEIIPTQDYNPYIEKLDSKALPTEAVLDDLQTYQLQQGERAAEGESFCPWECRQEVPLHVAASFFDDRKLYERTWDFFYLYRESPSLNERPILLVPTKQLQHFLTTINQRLNINLSIPTGAAKTGFSVSFKENGTPQPRYLGQSTDREMAESFKNNAPPSYYKLDNEPDVGSPSERSLEAFRKKIDLMNLVQKGKKLASKEKAKTDRIAKQQSWNHSIKRVQRYLGLREVRQGHHAAIREALQNSGLEWLDYDAAVSAAASKLPPSAAFDPAEPPRFSQEGSVVFICVDAEAYERNSSLITEIGIATLDTQDITLTTPGNGGANWMGKIRSRHFRINEYKNLHNTEFVNGCADKFEFGESEFINLKDAPHIISTCFKPPFSKPGATTCVNANDAKRNIILVGHSIGADISYLRTVGYDVHNLSNLQELIDTATMWQYLKRESNPRNLGAVLAELGIIGWNLHNAGNDATYTLQAMIAIAIKHLEERKKKREIRERESKTRIAESFKGAAETALEKEQGWSSGDEYSDGGDPIKPAAAAAKKGTGPQHRGTMSGTQGSHGQSAGSWRRAEEVPGSYSQSSKNQTGLGSGRATNRSPTSPGSNAAPQPTSQPMKVESFMKKMTLSDSELGTPNKNI